MEDAGEGLSEEYDDEDDPQQPEASPGRWLRSLNVPLLADACVLLVYNRPHVTLSVRWRLATEPHGAVLLFFTEMAGLSDVWQSSVLRRSVRTCSAALGAGKER